AELEAHTATGTVGGNLGLMVQRAESARPGLNARHVPLRGATGRAVSVLPPVLHDVLTLITDSRGQGRVVGDDAPEALRGEIPLRQVDGHLHGCPPASVSTNTL